MAAMLFARSSSATTLHRVAQTLALAACVAAPSIARADDGPRTALGNMLDASPTITSVTVGAVLMSDLAFTLIAARDAIRQESSEDAVYGVQLGVGGIQAVGFLAAPFAFDIHRWGAGENVLMLMPAQAMASMLTVHASWSIAPDPIDPASRLGVSALVGFNAAFTSVALGNLVQERWAPLELAIAEMAHSVLTISVSSERIANDADHRGEWGALLGWSALGLAHGVGSFLVEMPGSRVSEAPSPTELADAPPLVPFVQPLPGGAIVGVASAAF